MCARKRFWCPIAINESKAFVLFDLVSLSTPLIPNTPMRTFIISIEIWIVIRFESGLRTSISLSLFVWPSVAAHLLLLFFRLRMCVCLHFSISTSITHSFTHLSRPWAIYVILLYYISRYASIAWKNDVAFHWRVKRWIERREIGMDRREMETVGSNIKGNNNRIKRETEKIQNSDQRRLRKFKCMTSMEVCSLYLWIEEKSIKFHRKIYRKYKSNITDKWSRIELYKTNKNSRGKKANQTRQKKFATKRKNNVIFQQWLLEIFMVVDDTFFSISFPLFSTHIGPMWPFQSCWVKMSVAMSMLTEKPSGSIWTNQPTAISQAKS